MSTNDSAALQTAATDPDCTDHDLDERDVRALTERMGVLPDDGDDLHTVVGANQNGEYTVDARRGRCTCPDHEYRDVRCKHIRRVAFATGERAIPAGVAREDVDELLGAHLDAEPRFAVTDGGEVVEAAVSESDADVDDGRPDDCDCAAFLADADLPCWPCYREGFETPAPGVGEARR